MIQMIVLAPASPSVGNPSAINCKWVNGTTLTTEGVLHTLDQMVNEMVNCQLAADALLAALTVG